MLATLTTGRPIRRRAPWHFARHYLEMVVAMAIGMVALPPVSSWLLDRPAWTEALARPEIGVIVMVTEMTIPMAAWMRYRRHTWRLVGEMAAAMYLPFVALFVSLWAGWLSAAHLHTWGHALMLPAMLAAMIVRRAEYSHPRTG